jgi:hypothetical protein
MNDSVSVLEKFTQRVSESAEGRSAADSSAGADGSDDLGAFGYLRGIKDRAMMLELRKKNGNILAIGYGWLECDFDPSEGITVHAGRRTVRIKGRNLNSEIRPQIRLFESITRHRITWIREADESERIAAAKSATIIESIEW